MTEDLAARPGAAPVVERVAEASLEDVWAVLADGWLYPLWVVGAARIRDVDDGWPLVGSRLHHSFGIWPLLLDDTTEVMSVDEGRHLELRARGWPLGEAHVRLELTELGPHRTRVRLAETAVRGPGALLPTVVEAPPVRWRNREALRRLALLAEGRGATTRHSTTTPHSTTRPRSTR